MRLKSITISAFRGFNRELTLTLDSGVVVFYGLNGSGKSSLTEAVEWLFWGDIARQRLCKCKSEYQFQEYIRNIHADPGAETFVEIIGIINGEEHTIKRTRSARSKRSADIISIDGVKVDDYTSLHISLGDHQRPMLAQAEIRAIVDTEQKERWEQLSRLLGLDSCSILRSELQGLANSERDSRFQKLDAKYINMLEELTSVKCATASKALEDNQLNSFLGTIQNTLGCSNTIESLDQAKALVNTSIGELTDDPLPKLLVAAEAKGTDEFLTGLEHILVEGKKVVGKIRKELKNAIDVERLRFLETGLHLAKPPKCPFCAEESMSESKIKEIQSECDLLVAQGKAINALVGEVESLVKETHRLRSLMPGALPDSKHLASLAIMLNERGLVEEATSVQVLGSEMSPLSSAGIDSVSDCLAPLSELSQGNVIDLDSLELDLERKSGELKEKCAEIAEHWASIKAGLLTKANVGSQKSPDYAKQLIALDKAIAFLQVEYRDYRAKTLALRVAQDTISLLESFEKRMVRESLAELGDEIKNYYLRLNPDENTTFEGIEVKEDTKTRQARLVARSFGKDMNPVTMFSEAHSNALALSVYFPSRVDRNTGWGFMILDDPVQSMDMNHSAQLIEILAGLCERKQTIVLTHTKDFRDRLWDRLRHKEPLVYEFVEGGIDGPAVELMDGGYKDYLTLVRCEMHGTSVERESAGTNLRKAIENLCGEFLQKNGHSVQQVRSIAQKGVAALIEKCERAGMDVGDANRIHSHRRPASKDTHPWEIKDTSPGALLEGIQMVEELADKYNIR